jgi:hypothetical protein
LSWLATLAFYLFASWHAVQRRVDLQILWPACKREAEARGFDLEYAKAAFALHALQDPAWRSLGEDEVGRRIDRLR